MKTSMEDISSVKKRLLIEIDSEEVDRKLDEAYRKLGKSAKIPGFRPGKAPRSILETRFGPQVQEDVTRDLISETLPKAIDEVKTFPLGPPLLEKGILKHGQDFSYSAEMEIRPPVELHDYLGLEVKKEKCAISEEDVQERLEQIRKAHGKMTPLEEERPVESGDYVVLDYEAFEGDIPVEGIKSTNFLINVGSNDFHPQFEEALIGLKKGEEAEIPVDFEETYYHSTLAGKHITFKVKVTDIKEMVLPELDDEFVKSLGADFEDLAGLKEKVREAVTGEQQKRVDRQAKQELIDKISEAVDIELPPVLVEAELETTMNNVTQNLVRSGSSLEKAGLSKEKLREEFRPTSERRVKEMLILGEIARREDLTVAEEDLKEGFAELAFQTGQDPETIRKYYEARDLVDSLRERLLEEKTLNYLMEHAKVLETEKEPETTSSSEKEKVEP